MTCKYQHQPKLEYFPVIPYKYLLLIMLVVGITACTPKDNKQQEAEKNPMSMASDSFKIIGYIAGWEDFDLEKIDAKKLTHINYAFANVVDGKAVLEMDFDSGNMKKILALKNINPALKVLVSIGGWTWSKNFSDVALEAESRKVFAQSAVDMLKKFSLDGIDIDWEYPGQLGANNTYRPEDKQNFTLLMADLRSALEAHGKPQGKHYLLTIATGADTNWVKWTEMGKVQESLDFINIMTYDMYHGGHTFTGHHSGLSISDQAVEGKGGGRISAMSSVQGHIDAGVPASKIVLGIPFYGRMWKGVKNVNNGLYQDAETIGSIIAYKSLKKGYMADPTFKTYVDESAKAPYLWSADSAIFVSYENPTSLGLKTQYIKEKGLGGGMFWEYSLDYDQELLNALYNGLN
jgi:chitinase